VRRGELEAVLEKSVKREQREAAVRTRYASGELGLDINDMRPRLAEKGLKYVSDSSQD
jgi:4-hydroxy-4-methyl-2-oxoglutarate aldolase